MFSEKSVVPPGKYSLGKVLEIHKSCWPVVTFALSMWYQNYSVRMTLMNGYFSIYGILWVLKSNLFHDVNFYKNEKYITNLFNALINFTSVSVYFLFPYVTATNTIEITKVELLASLLFYVIGLFFHHCADAQKFYTLKYHSGSGMLLTEGFYSVVQHPNYMGEFMVWIGLIIVSGCNNALSYIPLLWLYLATVLVGIPEKEKSLSRYKNYSDWSNRTKILVPGVY